MLYSFCHTKWNVLAQYKYLLLNMAQKMAIFFLKFSRVYNICRSVSKKLVLTSRSSKCELFMYRYKPYRLS